MRGGVEISRSVCSLVRSRYAALRVMLKYLPWLFIDSEIYHVYYISWMILQRQTSQNLSVFWKLGGVRKFASD